MEFILAENLTVYRIGRAPDPWMFSEPRYSGNNRWDDRDGNFRTTYAGDDKFSCYVEILASLRPDTGAAGELLEGILEDPIDAREFPTPTAGGVPKAWLQCRMWAKATLTGRFVDVTAAATISHLRPRFLGLAKSLGFPDFDSAALKLAHPRELTQRVASRLYATRARNTGQASVSGVRFASRHGDDLKLWAIFEHPADTGASGCLSQASSGLIEVDDPELRRAFHHHGLTWA